MRKKPKKAFRQGAISPVFIAESIAKHQLKTDIGAHSIFMEPIRKIEQEGKELKAIGYSVADLEAEEQEVYVIREAAFEKFEITCMHIYHGLGEIYLGEIALFIFTSAVDREQARLANDWLVEQFKARVKVRQQLIFA